MKFIYLFNYKITSPTLIAEEEKQRLELQEKERLAGLSDKQKIQEYCDKLLAIQVPFPLKTKTWKAVAGWIRDHIADNRPA